MKKKIVSKTDFNMYKWKWMKNNVSKTQYEISNEKKSNLSTFTSTNPIVVSAEIHVDQKTVTKLREVWPPWILPDLKQ